MSAHQVKLQMAIVNIFLLVSNTDECNLHQIEEAFQVFFALRLSFKIFI